MSPCISDQTDRALLSFISPFWFYKISLPCLSFYQVCLRDGCSFQILEFPLSFFFLNFLFIYLFIFWLCWVFVSVRGLSLVVASGGHSSSRCAGLSLSRPLFLGSTGSRRASSVIVAHGPSCSVACGILPDQGPNPCPLHWQADSQPLRHQGSPPLSFSITLASTFSQKYAAKICFCHYTSRP